MTPPFPGGLGPPRVPVVNREIQFLLVSGPHAEFMHWKLRAHSVTLCRDSALTKATTWTGPRTICSRCVAARAGLEARLTRLYTTTPLAFSPPPLPEGFVR